MAGFDNDTMYASNVDFSGSSTPAPTVTLDGQLLIGSTASPNIRVGFLTAGAGISITNGPGAAITIAATGGLTPVAGLIPDAHTAPGTTPVVGNGSGNITVTGAQVASGVVGTNVIRTDSLAANTMTIEIQRSTTAAASTPADNGVSHFDSAIFTVGAGGFVSLVGGAVPPTQKVMVDANTAPGTNPVLPTAGGVMTVTGAQVAAGVVGTNVIRTDSLAANTYTIEIQRSTTAAASTPADNGVSHFDSAIFTVGAGGFVSLVGGGIPPSQKFAIDTSSPPGTNPVLPTAAGLVTITGNQIPAASTANAVRTNSLAANTYTVEVQRSTAVAASDVTKNGLSHFNSANFTVDANGFVSALGGGGGGPWQLIQSQVAAASATLTFNTNIINFTEILFIATGFTITDRGLVSFSPDNGSTLVNAGSAFVGPGVTGSTLAVSTAPMGFGDTGNRCYIRFTNLPGTAPRYYLAANYTGTSENIWGITDASAQINWIQLSVRGGGTMTGTVYCFGKP